MMGNIDYPDGEIVVIKYYLHLFMVKIPFLLSYDERMQC